MKNFKLLIVEDNPLQLSKLVFFAEKQGYEVVHTADNAEEGFQMAKRLLPDLLLVDIQLQGEKTGIDLGQWIKDNLDRPLIYLTSLMSNEILEHASRTDPAAYLVKPVDESSLAAAIELVRIKSRLVKADFPEELQYNPSNGIIADSLFVKVGKVLKRLRFEDILSIKASQLNYSALQSLNGQTFEVRKPLSELENILPPHFCRIHRQRIINCHFVESIKSDFSSLVLNEERINIGVTYRKDISRRVPSIG